MIDALLAPIAGATVVIVTALSALYWRRPRLAPVRQATRSTRA